MLVAVRFDISLFETRPTLRNLNNSYIAIPVKVDIGVVNRWESVIWLDAKESAIYIFGDFPSHFKIPNIRFQTTGLIESTKYLRRWKFYLVTASDPVHINRGGQM